MSHKINFKKVILALVGGIIAGSMIFYILRGYYEHQQFEKQTRQKIIYWKSVVGEHDNYPDGWVKLSINWYKLGEEELAQLAINKAEQLDPINDEISSIKEKLLNPKHKTQNNN